MYTNRFPISPSHRSLFHQCVKINCTEFRQSPEYSFIIHQSAHAVQRTHHFVQLSIALPPSCAQTQINIGVSPTMYFQCMGL